MTVEQLIRKLATFPSHLRVVTPGFDESNLDDVETVELTKVRFTKPLGTPNHSHCGAHPEDEQLLIPNAVLINW